MSDERRPDIPMALRRAVLVEAGHRCAIPTCRSTPVELAHIEPWSKVREHTFDNLISLCPTCHTRYDRGDIDRLSMRQYKANLGVLFSRYNAFELRLLEALGRLVANGQAHETFVVPGGMDFAYMYLIEDGLVQRLQINTIAIGDLPQERAFRLTPKGIETIQKWFGASPIE